MNPLYSLMVGLVMIVSPSSAASDTLSDNDRFIKSLNKFTQVASSVTVNNEVVISDPTKNGKPVYILAGSPQVDFGGWVGYVPTANIVLVGNSCTACSVTVNRYFTGSDFDHYIIQFNEPE